MFSFVSNASKVTLIHLLERLKVGGFKILDTQFINQHLKQFGALEVSNKKASLAGTMGENSLFVSKLSPCKNCCEPWKATPVYQTPPPFVMPIASIPPVVAVAKLEVVHAVLVVSLSLYNQEHPFDIVGVF